MGIRVSSIEFHDDDEIHKNKLFILKNALLNFQEMLQGKEKLESYPLNLGVDLYGKCNIKPPCVYCLWDKMKELEGDLRKLTKRNFGFLRKEKKKYTWFFLNAR